MSTDPTLPQAGEDRLRSQEMSLRHNRPPGDVAGYDLERFLGAGAYGEVWVAVERNTGRHVAIKFYSHRGGLDWSLLSREVEKLAFLFADRYVVQLIGVGWDADPPYYVMEYVEQGSLADRLQRGPLTVEAAVTLFREVAIGLVHAHGKGVLHCDLKPANVLLDQDGKPRLADFGQSRLSHEQVPALGTLFYMAPEQADLAAVPDARWDVYALGALLYCMLTGGPPYRTEQLVQLLERTTDLDQRLVIYRRAIRRATLPGAHRDVPGVDRALAEIVERCLAADPAARYPNVQAVLDALEARAVRRARRPTLVLGTVAPLVLLCVVSLFAWQGFRAAVRQHEGELTARALSNNELSALRVAEMAAKELQRRFDAVEQVAASPRLREALRSAVEKPELGRLLDQLGSPELSDARRLPLREQFLNHPDRQAIQQALGEAVPGWMQPPAKDPRESTQPATDPPRDVASWFVCDAHGVSTARLPQSQALDKTTVGKVYAWRTFFHGGERDREEDFRSAAWRPADEHLQQTSLSAVFRSQATGQWIVAIASPLFDPQRRFLGVVALTMRVNRFVELPGSENQFPVLVDLRPGDHTGRILQHRLFDRLLEQEQKLPARVHDYCLAPDGLPMAEAQQRDYRDPVAADPEGQDFDKHWLARIVPVSVRGKPSGWAVIVQESYDTSIGMALERLRSALVAYGLAAGGMVLLVLAGLWGLSLRLLNQSAPLRMTSPSVAGTEHPSTGLTPSADHRMLERNPS